MSNTIVCAHCGQIVPEDESFIVDGDPWCQDCMTSEAYECEHCGQLTAYPQEVHVMQEDYVNRTTRYWCSNCVDADAVKCDECGGLFTNDLVHAFTIIDADGDPKVMDLCDACLHRAFFHCDDCLELCRDDDLTTTDDGIYCPACAEHHLAIVDYGHTYADVFQTSGTADPYPELFMGIELETESDKRFEMARDLRASRFGHLLTCKRDGSLTDGCEIVTQPCTPDYHLHSGMWEKVTQTCLDYDATSHDNGDCGLHIHVSKSFFGSRDSAYECAYLIDTWLSANRDAFQSFSRRSTHQLAEWARFSAVDYPKDFTHNRKMLFYTSDKGCSRYLAINTMNSDTIEFRLWRGTLNLQTLRATIELTAGLCILARALRARDEIAEAMPWQRLRSLVLTSLHLAGLPNSDLIAYLEKKGL